MDLTDNQKTIIKAYVKVVRGRIALPSREDMEKAGVTMGQIKHHFGSLYQLRKAAKSLHPDVFKNLIDEEIYNPASFKKLQDKAAKYSRFVVTTAVTGCPVHKGFYKSIKRYCKENKALLLVLPSTDPASTAGFTMDPSLSDEVVVFDDLSLNRNLFISTIKLSAKHIDPITGLGRIGQRNGSFIYASPKQRLKMVPTSNRGYPHALMTTGAITVPDYHTTRYLSERTAYIANVDHVLGALVVEIESDRIFHYRQIQAERSGNFVDLGVYYRPDGLGTLKPKAMVLGDYHTGETDTTAEKCWLEVLDTVGAETVVFHDLFNGASVNHHEMDQHITRAIRAIDNQLELEPELKMVADVLKLYSEKADQLVVVDSNHHDFLVRWLEEGRYVTDPKNKRIGLLLALEMLDGKNPVKSGVEMVGGANPKVRWLQRDEDFKIARIELGAHGDMGLNGGSGSVSASETAYGLSVDGHGHSAEILRGAWRVGTSSFLKLDYNKGASSWSHTSCLVYPNGARQLINVIEGKWKI